MKRALALLVFAGCERAGGETYAIGWEGPKAGEQVEVISQLTSHGAESGDHALYEHAKFQHATVDGDRITSEIVRYLDYRIDGEAIPRTSYTLVSRDGKLELTDIVGGVMSQSERAGELESARLTFADPAPRKRLVLHRFHIGERYRLPADEADALGLVATDVTLALRAAKGDTRSFDVDGHVTKDGQSWILHGTLDTDGPNYRYFHQVIELSNAGERLVLDHLQRRP